MSSVFTQSSLLLIRLSRYTAVVMGSSMADKYQLLQGTESEDGVYQSVLPYQPSRKQRLGIWGLIIALAVSVLSNAALLYQQIRIQPSEFAINSRYGTPTYAVTD